MVKVTCGLSESLLMDIKESDFLFLKNICIPIKLIVYPLKAFLSPFEDFWIEFIIIRVISIVET